MIHPTVVSLLVRGMQFATIGSCLGLCARLVSYYPWYDFHKLNLALATGSLSAIYFICLAIVSFVPRLINVFYMFVVEFILFILWIASFAVLFENYGKVDCSLYFMDYSICHIGKAAMVLAAVNWISFLLTMVLLKKFSFDPISNVGSNEWQADSFYPGILFYKQKAPGWYKDESTAPTDEGGNDGDVPWHPDDVVVNRV